jgi:predicted transcriptional regulator
MDGREELLDYGKVCRATNHATHAGCQLGKATSVRLSDDLVETLDKLAAAMGRTRAWVIEDAIRYYIENEAENIFSIAEALEEVRSGNAVLIPHEEVMDRLDAKIAEWAGDASHLA